MKKIIVSIFSLSFFLSNTYSLSSRERVDAIAVEFNKEKNKEKEKNGVITGKHKVVEAKPDVRDNIASYACKYELNDFGDYIVFRYLSNNWEADYIQLQNSKEEKKAILKDIKIESALLMATIQYQNGKTLPFEGVFINRFVNGERTDGLGIKQVLDLSNGFIVDRVFFKRG